LDRLLHNKTKTNGKDGTMGKITSLKPEQLYQHCNQDEFPFNTTEELEDLIEIIGQTRAVSAVKFGISIKQEGYHLFALGSSAIAKYSVIRHFLQAKASKEVAPFDWCYVNNFEYPNKPKLLQLPAGKGLILHKDIEHLVEELCSVIPAIFESDDYRRRKASIRKKFKLRQEKAFKELQKRAKAESITLMPTEEGIVCVPVKKGQVISPQEYEKLSEKEREDIEKQIKIFSEEFIALSNRELQLQKECRKQIKELNKEVTSFAVGHLVDELRKKYTDLLDVVNYLDTMQKDVIDNSNIFLNKNEISAKVFVGRKQSIQYKNTLLLARYKINLLVDNSETKGTPVIYEDNPNYHNLVGQIEHLAHMGSLVTDFSLIKAGALHKANGGYLVIDAYKVLSQPYAWEGLKRALRSLQLKIESLEQMLSLATTVTLEPEPIPLNIKVVLLGERWLYYLLYERDPEFKELFKVTVDFSESMDRSQENTLLYAKLIATLGRKEKLYPFDRSAVARIIEQSARLVSDSEKLSAHMKTITDLMRESDYWAKEFGHKVVSVVDVEQAIDSKIHRNNQIQEILQEQTHCGTILIDTQGEKVGQVNGLSVMELGDFTFGQPTRITASVRLGKGEVIDIEREVKLGGPIHSKGVLILSAFLGSHYALDKPLSLHASLVFEQSYNRVEGDSASSAELYVLLSALADVPIKQSFAVTGSVNQHGQVQAIGGVNEKIEGFFDVCKARELTGNQGVLIPISNVKHLMLKKEVIEAVKDNKFHIYAIETIDQGIEILTGISAGERDTSGRFPKGSINQKVESRLLALAEKRLTLNSLDSYVLTQ
jgi:lon-related putative ATP-dependent protease